MRFLCAAIFICTLGFLTAYAAPVSQNPTLAEWLAKGAIPKYKNGDFIDLMTNADIEKDATEKKKKLDKELSRQSGRGKPAFDRLKWEQEQKQNQKSIHSTDSNRDIPPFLNCAAVVMNIIGENPKSCVNANGFKLATFYANCERGNAFRGSSVTPLIKHSNQCLLNLGGCITKKCPNQDAVKMCLRIFDQCSRNYRFF